MAGNRKIDSRYKQDRNHERVTAERLREFATDKKPVSGIERLDDLDLPAMVVIGEKVAAVPVEQQKMLAKRIPGAKMVVYPEEGHMVTYEQ